MGKLLGIVVSQVNERGIMSNDYSAIKNKQQRHPKVSFNQYIGNIAEPRDNIIYDLPVEFEHELFGDSHAMRNRLRCNAHKMRSQYR